MNRNVMAIKALYEAAFDTLHDQIRGITSNNGSLGLPSENLRNQVTWLHELSRCLPLISQIESARQPAPPPAAQTPHVSKPVIPSGLADFNPSHPTQPRRNNDL